jgi:hypothetical protein
LYIDKYVLLSNIITILKMSELDLLKILPKEQFTEYKGKCIQVRDLIKILEKQNEKNTNNGITRRRKNNTGN